MPKRTASTTWRTTRARVLEAYPTCYWCGTRPSTEADHLIEHDAGGTDDESNLVGACKPCNGRRGQAYKARRDAQRAQARARFSTGNALPPTPTRALSGDDQRRPARTRARRAEPAPTGRQVPRLETPRLGGATFGPAVAAWSRRHLKVDLMPWQVHALSGQLEYVDDPDTPGGFRFVHREALVSVARQCGKSVALSALIGWWLTDYARMIGIKVNVLSVANRLDRAEEIFTALSPILLENYGGRALNTFGRKSLHLETGTWQVRASSSNLHGGTFSLIVCDEVWDVSEEAIETALRPSQVAVVNPLLSMWSTAGDESSSAMIDYREKAVADIDAKRTTSNYFAEWSIPPGVDPADESYWGYPNPALGTTITLDTLRHRAGGKSFLRSHLNIWIVSRGAWLNPGVWEDLHDDKPLPSGGVLAVDSSLDDNRYVGVRAVEDGKRVRVALEFATTSEDELWQAIDAVMVDKQVTLAITPGLATHLPTKYQRRAVTVGYAEMVRYTAVVKSMIVEGRVVHRGSELLNEHVARAVASRAKDGLVLSSQKSPGPIEAARCAVWAVGIASRAQNKQRPLLVVAQ